MGTGPKEAIIMAAARLPNKGNLQLIDELNEAPLSLFHYKAAITAGMGFFTDSYDLFIIGPALALAKTEFHASATTIGLVGSISLIAAFLGAIVFGRLADVIGRKKIYGLEAAIMAAGAIASAFSPSIYWLIVFRFILGFGIGGDYPVSAVLMSEYSNRKNRGRLVGLVFSMQALGLVVGPMVAVTLLASGVPGSLAWRLMLGLGAIPAAAVIYMRRHMPESPRFQAKVKGEAEQASLAVKAFSGGVLNSTTTANNSTDIQSSYDSPVSQKLSLFQFLSNPKYLLTLLGTAGSWFVFDYAYYGNAISTPLILKGVAPSANALTSVAISLLIFVVAAVPGYILAFTYMDRIGHKKLQIIGFIIMGACFGAIGFIPSLVHNLVPFLVIYGVSFLFAEFGPNTTTFVLSAELFPVSARTTGHGLSAGIAKFGAFIGVFIFPILNKSLGLSHTLLVTFAMAIVGALVTLVLPEPSGKTLEELSGEDVVPISNPSNSKISAVM